MNSYGVAYNNWIDISEKLRKDKDEYTKFLKFSSGIYKHGFADSALIYRQNPNATKVADLKTWNRLGRRVNKGEHSVVTFGENGKCNYLFDVSQTSGKKEPALWKLDEDLAKRVTKKLNDDYGLTSKNLNEAISKLAADSIRTKYQLGEYPQFYNGLTYEQKRDFNRSMLSASRYIVSNRCMLDGDIELDNNLNLKGMDYCKNAVDFRHFGNIVHDSAQNTLLMIEKKVLEAIRDRAMEQQELENAKRERNELQKMEEMKIPFTIGTTFEIDDVLYAVENIDVNSSDVTLTDISTGNNYQRNMSISELTAFYNSEQQSEQDIFNAIDGIIGKEVPIIENEYVETVPELKPLDDENVLNSIFDDNSVRYERNEQITEFFRFEEDFKDRAEYIKSIFHDSGEFEINGTKYGFEKTETGLNIYEGTPDNRIRQSGISFEAISAKYADMIENKELSENQGIDTEIDIVPENEIEEIDFTELSEPSRRIICETPDEAEKLFSSLRNDGYTWIDGEELERTDWVFGEENTYYSIDEENKTVDIGNYSALSIEQQRNSEFERFSDIQSEYVIGAEFTEQEEHKYDLYYSPRPDRILVDDLNSENREPIAEINPDRSVTFTAELPESVKNTIKEYADKMPEMFVMPEIREPLPDEPMVSIPFSESGYFPKDVEMPFSQANEVFEAAESHYIESRNNKLTADDYMGYDKTDFVIKGNYNGKPFEYSGRFDIGDGESTLINHIRNEYEYYKTANADDAVKEFEEDILPYLEKYKSVKSYETSLKEVHTVIDLSEYGLKTDLKDTDKLVLEDKYLNYEGGIDSDGHERKDNYSQHEKSISISLNSDGTASVDIEDTGDIYRPYDSDTYDLTDKEQADELKDFIKKFIENSEELNVYTKKNDVTERIDVQKPVRDFSDIFKPTKESDITNPLNLEKGDVIRYEGKRYEVEELDEHHINMKDLDAPDFGGVILSSNEVLSYDGWQNDMKEKGFEILSRSEEKNISKPEKSEADPIHSAFESVKNNHDFNDEQLKFLERAEKQMTVNNFDDIVKVFDTPTFQQTYGSFRKLNEMFDNNLKNIIDEVNNNLKELHSDIEKYDLSENITSAEKSQGLFSIEQYNAVKYFKTEETTEELLKTAANAEQPFVEMVKHGQPISESEYAEIQQSDKFAYSVDMDFNENTAKIYTVNNGIGGISEENRNEENTEFQDVNISDYKRKYTREENYFLNNDITEDVSRVLAYDEIESLSYVLYDENHDPKYEENSIYGNGLDGNKAMDFREKFRNGEDISAEFGKALMGKVGSADIRIDGSMWNTFEVELKHGENSVTAKYGDLEKEIPYSAVGQNILDKIRKEHIDIEVYRAVEDNGLPDTKFTAIDDEKRKFLEMHKYVPVPETTPWGEPQNYYEINKGIFDVSTAGHGGIMIKSDIADKLLSPEARKIGFKENGFHCFEEDCDSAIAYRELIDKGLFRDIKDFFAVERGTTYEKNFDNFNETVTGMVKRLFPDYYEKRNEAIFNAFSEDKQAELTGQMMFGTEQENTDEKAMTDKELSIDNAQPEIEVPVEPDKELTDNYVDMKIADSSIYEGMSAFIGEDNHIYIGKTENLNSRNEYDNSDNSLIHISDSRAVHELLTASENGVSNFTQQEALDEKIYTLEDYRELTRLQNGVLSQFEQKYPVKFGGEEFKPVSDETVLAKPEKVKAQNYRFNESDIVEGGAKTKYKANIEAIKTLYKVEKENRNATPEEQSVMAKYSGWGGIPQAFDKHNEAWKNEYEELKNLLADSEYKAARSSTNTAFYTPPEVTEAVYQGLSQLGFEGGNILEPSCGVGNFIAKMPETIADNSNVYGVELDSISGRIAQKLYPESNIQVKGFEQTTFKDNSFDVVVGNIPFGDFSVNDREYNKHNFKIHDYFAAKAIDKAKPNGVVAIVTSKFTMDKQNEDLRRYIAERAKLLGAVRLPSGTFKDADNVTTDILFFQKKESRSIDDPDWVHFSQTADGVPCNKYFVDNPDMVLGKMEFDKRMQGKFGEDSKVTVCSPTEGSLKEKLTAAISKIQGKINTVRTKTEDRKNSDVIPANPDVRNYTHTLVDGQLYYRQNEIMTKVKETGLKLERMKGLHDIRTAAYDVINAQVNNCSDKELKALQKTLNDVYDKFVKKYGNIHDKANAKAFEKDDDYNTIRALEIVNKKTGKLEKAEIFSERTITAEKEIDHVETSQEALQVSIDKKGKVDIEYMAELTNKKPDEVIKELGDEIFRNPLKAENDKPYSGYEDKSEYLSGNIYEKLDTAKAFAQSEPEYERNVSALEQSIPTRLEAHDISASIGVSWVDVEDYTKFMAEVLNANMNTHGLRRDLTGEYHIQNKNYGGDVYATQTHGTTRMNSYQIFENLLNKRDLVIRDKTKNEDGKEIYVVNRKETEKAKQKGEEMKRAFKNWIFKDFDRREKYVEKYNRLFNGIKGREYDGSHQTFVGMNPAIKLRSHQENAILRGKLGGNTLLAHCVGAGKSFEIDTIVMEKKRLGLIHKACVVVPKHLTLQTAEEWQRLYPNAKLLVATPKDFEKNNRKEFLAKCVTGDYDGIIMSYEQFGKIPMSNEYQQNFIQNQIDSLEQALSETDQSDRASVKDIERTLKKLQTKLEKLLDKPKDESLNFEQMGFDYIAVDEAHNYKNCLVVSKMHNVAGVQTTSAAKSEDMLMKSQFLRDKYGDGTLLMATGTPLSNSMVELYSMTRYLRPDLLQKAGLQTFDDWASNFGEVTTQLEMKPAGNGFQMKKRFAQFCNLPELMQMYKEFADIKMADSLKIPNVPVMESGKPITVKCPADELQLEYMKELARRSEEIHSGNVKPTEDNMLKITHEARLLGLDSRTINPDWKPDSECKVMKLCDNIEKIRQNTEKEKGVQIVFCDIAIHDTDGHFSVYKAIKDELKNRGIPENEICFAGDAKTDKQRADMFDELRKGEKRIILASTSKLGTGANVQDRVAAIHHLDIPWRPADLEQQNGRGLRQGNMFKEVGIYHYVTENTFDAYMLGIITSKAKFISQVMTSKNVARTCQDVDEMVLNYAEMQAITSGNPLLAKKVQLEYDLATLRLLDSEHTKKQFEMEELVKKVLPKKIEENTVLLQKAKSDLAKYVENKPVDSEHHTININGTDFTERKEAAAELEKLIMKCIANNQSMKVGSYAGFELSIEKNPNYGNQMTINSEVPCFMKMKGELTYQCDLALNNGTGNITRIENLPENMIGKRVDMIANELEKNHTNMKAAQEELGKEFPQAEELMQKQKELDEIDSKLGMNKSDEVIVPDDDETPENDKSENIEDNRDSLMGIKKFDISHLQKSEEKSEEKTENKTETKGSQKLDDKPKKRMKL